MPKLHLGCGNLRKDGYINIDNRELPSVDLVRDITKGLPFSDETIDEVYSENFMEHIPQSEVIFVMNEIWRVLKPGGIAHHMIPLAGTPNDFQDPTHLSRWHPDTFLYFTKDHKKNEYYGEYIKPWNIELCTVVEPKLHTIEVKLIKP